MAWTGLPAYKWHCGNLLCDKRGRRTKEEEQRRLSSTSSTSDFLNFVKARWNVAPHVMIRCEGHQQEALACCHLDSTGSQEIRLAFFNEKERQFIHLQRFCFFFLVATLMDIMECQVTACLLKETFIKKKNIQT